MSDQIMQENLPSTAVDVQTPAPTVNSASHPDADDIVIASLSHQFEQIEDVDLNCLKCGARHYVVRWIGDWRQGHHAASVSFFHYGKPRFIGMTKDGDLNYLFICRCGGEISYTSPKPKLILDASDLPFPTIIPVPTDSREREYEFLYCLLCDTSHAIVRFKDGTHDPCSFFQYGNPRFLGQVIKTKKLLYLFSCTCGEDLYYASPPPPTQEATSPEAKASQHEADSGGERKADCNANC
ncbi:hypothetical protein CCACVL1_21448 [Corchorus capsularis]|uniref:Uncharacterized protein n=1 Tax=Corchorus capsularis TaxID=210143 RepID=A0A1R3H5L6_COCAP|nr:hypothetical protein CCACVL1_21448 [Corchorus capsularis]